MTLEHGTEEEHIGTLERAKQRGENSFYVWSGDLRRNAYLRENLNFGVDRGLIRLEEVDMSQETGYDVFFLK